MLIFCKLNLIFKLEPLKLNSQLTQEKLDEKMRAVERNREQVKEFKNEIDQIKLIKKFYLTCKDLG